MTINLKVPDIHELKPRITVCGVGGAGGNAVNNMIEAGLEGVDFLVANTDAQALTSSKAQRVVQMGLQVTQGLGAGSQPDVGRAAAEEVLEEIRDLLSGQHMAFITAGMGGGTGTGAAPVIARCAREMGILTVGVVTKPFQFEGARRMRTAELGIEELQKAVDTLIVIPNQNLFRVANERTTFADAFAMADQVLYSGVACITDLMVKEGLINLDFADVRAVMRDMGKAMMGTGQANGERRAITAAEGAIANPLLDETSMRGARGLLISITGGNDLTLYEVDEAATRIREEVDPEANIILGATFDPSLDGQIRVSVVATGIDQEAMNASRGIVTEAPVAAVAAQVMPQQQSVADITKAMQEASRRLTENARNATMQTARMAELSTAPVEAPIAEAPAAETIPHLPLASAASTQREPVTVGNVLLEQMPVRPPLFVEPIELDQPVAQQDLAPPPSAFIPPAAEKPLSAPRMPTISDLPLPGQQLMNQAQADSRSQGDLAAPASGEKRRISLLDRLSQVGLSGVRRAEDTPAAPSRVAPPVAEAPVRRPAPPAMPAQRREPAGLDMHGRPMAQRPTIEDDNLDIPAFLRRQAT